MKTKLPHSPLWYPYAPLQTMSEPLEVVHAQGAELHLADGRVLIDGIASWWCAVHGYNRPELNQALEIQMRKFSHVMMGGLVHSSARNLATRLVEVYPGMAGCFFADSGSVGVEVALKMACQYWTNLGIHGKNRFVSLEGGYHGDTAGAMSVGEPADEMHQSFGGLIPAQFFCPRPQGWPARNLQACVDALESILKEQGHQIAAMICEPMMQGYGGFQIYDPEYLRCARTLCDQYDVLLIFDEVATGFGRTAKLFACEYAGVQPDIAILGKALSAGYMGLSATLASDKVYSAFWSSRPEHALMHGPTFMGNALACAVALASLELFFEQDRLGDAQRIEAQFMQEWGGYSHPDIKEIRILGAMMVIECQHSDVWKGLREFAAERGLWIRPFRNFIYLMPPLVINRIQLDQASQVIKEWFSRRSPLPG